MPRQTRSAAAESSGKGQNPGPNPSSTTAQPARATRTTAAAAASPASTDPLPPQKRGRGRPCATRVVQEDPGLEPNRPPKPPQPTKPAAAKAAKTTKGRGKTKAAIPAASPAPPGPAPVSTSSQKSKMVELADGVWAAMEETDAREMAERAAHTVRRLSDIPEVVGDESDGVEEFHLTDISGSSDDDDNNEDGGPVETAVNKASTSEIELLKARIAQLKALEHSKTPKALKGKKTTSRSKNGAKKAQTTVASGLRSSYHQAALAHATKTTRSGTESPLELGGLDDDDLEDTRPTPSTLRASSSDVPSLAQLGVVAKNVPRNSKQANQDVLVVDESTSQPQCRPQSKAQPTVPQHRAPTVSSTQHRAPTVQPRLAHQQAANPQPVRPAYTQPQVAPTRQRGAALQRHETFIIVEPTAVRVTSNHPPNNQPDQGGKRVTRLNANGVRVTDLPSFTNVDNKWKDTFLPTLYHTLFLSSETFNAFKVSSSDFCDTIQQVVDLVYPEDAYTIELGDPILLTAYNRINRVRTGIANDAMKQVQEFLKTTYGGRPGEAYEWLLWARNLKYGPLFFEQPSPLRSTLREDDSSFIFPSGRLRSPFILSVVQTSLKMIDGTLKDRTLPPVGLFSITMAALERAVFCLKPDATIDPTQSSQFCQAKWGGAIVGYMNSFAGVSSEKWAVILSLCQETPADSDTEAPVIIEDIQIIQRVNIFNFPSPTK